jgi:hypothetical protein
VEFTDHRRRTTIARHDLAELLDRLDDRQSPDPPPPRPPTAT